jgi:malate dehydrogenase (quinone)
MHDVKAEEEVDVALVGAGIMSTTLGVFLKELQPHLKLEILERLPGEAEESSGAWNNAGTGHAANCELNYTPMDANGNVDIAKALEVNVEFDMSRQFWSYLIKKGAIASPEEFIHPVPHMSFVIGAERQDFLRKRHAIMSSHHCYHGMEYSEDHTKIAEWAPLIMAGRDPQQPVAATRMITGADVNYGALTSSLLGYLKKQDDFVVRFSQNVVDLHRRPGGGWRLDVRDEATGARRTVNAKYVFLRVTLPRSTAWRLLAPLRCQYPIWIPASSTASAGCYLGPTQGFRPDSSSRARLWIYQSRYGQAISCRCLRSRVTIFRSRNT